LLFDGEYQGDSGDEGVFRELHFIPKTSCRLSRSLKWNHSTSLDLRLLADTWKLLWNVTVNVLQLINVKKCMENVWSYGWFSLV